MTHTYNSLSQTEGKFSFTISEEDLNPFLNAVISQYQETLDIKGFRKGKIPRNIIEQRIGLAHLREEALERALPDFLDAATQEAKVSMYGTPRISLDTLTGSGDITFSATFTKIPEVTLSTYTGLGLKKQVAAVSEKDVTRALEELQKLYAKEVAITRPSANGDKVIVDYETFLDNVPVEGGKATQQPLILGETERMLIPGFAEQLVGVTPNQKKEFVLTLPKDFHLTHLAGRQVQFRVNVKNVFEVQRPPLDDAFAKTVGKFSTLAELRKALNDNLLSEAKTKADHALEGELMQTLIKKNPCTEIPTVMIADESERMLEELEQSVTREGGKFDDYLAHIKKTKEQLKKEFTDRAIARIKSALLLREVAHKHQLHATDEDIDKTIAEEKKRHAHDPHTAAHLDEPHMRRRIANMLTSQNVLNYLKKENTSM